MSPLVGRVESAQWLTPSMIRIRFGGDGLSSFSSTESTDQYVNALFIPDGAPYSAPFDMDAAQSAAPELRPRGRRFTVRRWEPDDGILTIDFAVHGDVGYAGRWAQNAKPGDLLQMAGPSGGYRPNPEADWYLLAGDESALPAIAASAEAIERGKRCVAFVIVDGPEHESIITSPSELEVHWLHRCTSSNPELLLTEAIAQIGWAPGMVDVFVHGEAADVRAARRHLLADRDIDRSAASISPYWRREHDDEAWRSVKRQWLMEQEADV